MSLILQFSLALLISLSGLFFACAEGSPIGGITPLIAMLTLYFVDWKKQVSVPAIVLPLLGLIAFVAAAVEFFGGPSEESRLLAGGHLIVYLSWVFLIQRKEHRHYWWICALSVLQMAVASVLTTDLWFGMALVVYAFTASWTLSVFLLIRALPADESDASEPMASPVLAASTSAVPVSGDSTQSETPRTFLHAGRQSAIGGVRKGVARDVDRRLLNWRFVGSTFISTCLALVLSLMFFLFTPRIWIGQYSIFSDAPLAGRPLTGFTEEVRLGDMGEILENSDPVMEVRLIDRESQAEFNEFETLAYLRSEPLFRGAVLEVYDSGRWQRGPSVEPTPVVRFRSRGDVIQRYQLQPIGTPTLFAFGNVITMQSVDAGDPRILRDTFTMEFYRSEERRRIRTFEYDVYSDHEPADTHAAAQRQAWPRGRQEIFRQYLGSLRIAPAGMERVQNLAFSLVEGLNSPAQAADRIESYLLDSSRFTYSLKLSVQDPNVDPIEDFLLNRQEGHCEYFASSMVILLRSVGVPARLISGFKGGVYNRRRKAFVVQQLHAHTWVEAYIDGQWRTYDPTPESRNTLVSATQGRESIWIRLSNPVKSSWEFGVRMSQQQQQQQIYQPIADLTKQGWTAVRDTLQGKGSLFTQLLTFVRSPDRWFSWQGGVFAFILMSLVSGTVWIVRRLLRMTFWSAQGRGAERRRRRVDFYDRFVQILARQQITQRSTQTAREFVEESLIHLNGRFTQSGLDTWSGEFVDLFYQVRFGGKELTAAEAEDINQRLNALEACLSSKARQHVEPPG